MRIKTLEEPGSTEVLPVVTVNQLVPGSSPGRGAKFEKAHLPVGFYLLGYLILDNLAAFHDQGEVVLRIA